MALAAILSAVLGEHSAGIVPSQALLALCLLARMHYCLLFKGTLLISPWLVAFASYRVACWAKPCLHLCQKAHDR